MQGLLGPAHPRTADLFGTASLARAGGAMFVISGLVAFVVGTFVLGAGGPAVSVLSAVTVVAGAAIVRMPVAWSQNAMFAQSVLAFAIVATVSRLVPEVLEPFLPFYVLIFVTIGMTQRPLALPLSAPVAVATFLWSTGGTAPDHVVENFVIVLAVGLVAAGVLARVTAQRRQAAQVLEHLVEAVAALPGAADTLATAERLEESVVQFLDADRVVCFLEREPGSEVFEAVGPTRSGGPTAATVDLHAADIELRRGEDVFVADVTSDARLAGHEIADDAARSVVFIPLHGSQSLIGGCAVVWDRVVPEPAPASRLILRLLTTEAGLIFERHLATERLSVEASTDPLTGLLNRRAIDRRLGRLRPGDGVVLVDLDDFKGVNDEDGHVAGDRTLRQLARVMSDSCREGDDWCGRFGGDEFVMVLRDAGDVGIRAVTDVMRRSWAAEAPLTTFSAGGAVHHDGDDAAATLRRADEALYRAKDLGRDRTEVDDPAPGRRASVRQSAGGRGVAAGADDEPPSTTTSAPDTKLASSEAR